MFSTAPPQSLPIRLVNMRRTWVKAHRWPALGVGWLLALVGLIGALLIVAKPLDRWSLTLGMLGGGVDAPERAL